MFVYVIQFKLLNQLTHFQEILYQYYVTSSYPKVIISIFLQSNNMANLQLRTAVTVAVPCEVSDFRGGTVEIFAVTGWGAA